MIQCNIYNKLGYKIDQDKIKERVVGVIIEKAKVKGDLIVDVHFVNTEQMRQLHKKHMELDEVTDVLSFPLEYDQSFPDKKVRLGDVVICGEEARNRHEEPEFLAEHGVLHLLGYHHE